MFLNKDNSIRWKWIAAATVLAAALCAACVLWLDEPALFLLRKFDGAWTQIIDIVFSFKAWLIALAALLAASLFWRSLRLKDKFSWKLIASNHIFFVLCSVLCAGFASAILKFFIGRMRPVFLEALGTAGFYPFTNEWAFNSMPSGHAAASFAGLVMAGMLMPRFKAAFWCFAAIIGISRICAGAHFPSDVLLGAFIGMICADYAKSLLMRGRAIARPKH
jgi:membrane-associated phospholipid phosphatase